MGPSGRASVTPAPTPAECQPAARGFVDQRRGLQSPSVPAPSQGPWTLPPDGSGLSGVAVGRRLAGRGVRRGRETSARLVAVTSAAVITARAPTARVASGKRRRGPRSPRPAPPVGAPPGPWIPVRRKPVWPTRVVSQACTSVPGARAGRAPAASSSTWSATNGARVLSPTAKRACASSHGRRRVSSSSRLIAPRAARRVATSCSGSSPAPSGAEEVTQGTRGPRPLW